MIPAWPKAARAQRGMHDLHAHTALAQPAPSPRLKLRLCGATGTSREHGTLGATMGPPAVWRQQVHGQVRRDMRQSTPLWRRSIPSGHLVHAWCKAGQAASAPGAALTC